MTKILPPEDMAGYLKQNEKRLSSVEGQLGTLAKDKVYPHAQLPAPADREGAHLFDDDLGRPLWSNGAAWVGADGVVPGTPSGPPTCTSTTRPAITGQMLAGYMMWETDTQRPIYVTAARSGWTYDNTPIPPYPAMQNGTGALQYTGCVNRHTTLTQRWGFAALTLQVVTNAALTQDSVFLTLPTGYAPYDNIEVGALVNDTNWNGGSEAHIYLAGLQLRWGRYWPGAASAPTSTLPTGMMISASMAFAVAG